jgi:hypothetical protein
MRILSLFSALVLAALSLPASSQANDTRPPAPVLRGQQCLDPDFARSFIDLDDRSLLVDAGRYRYRIEVSASCWNLDHTPVIGFRADPVAGRVCGGPFDAVIVRGGHPCRIERMELLSKAEYQDALKHREDSRHARRIEREAHKK